MIVKWKSVDFPKCETKNKTEEKDKENVDMKYEDCFFIAPIRIEDNVLQFKNFRDMVQFYIDDDKDDHNLITLEKECLDFLFVMNDKGETIERIK